MKNSLLLYNTYDTALTANYNYLEKKNPHMFLNGAGLIDWLIAFYKFYKIVMI